WWKLTIQLQVGHYEIKSRAPALFANMFLWTSFYPNYFTREFERHLAYTVESGIYLYQSQFISSLAKSVVKSDLQRLYKFNKKGAFNVNGRYFPDRSVVHRMLLDNKPLTASNKGAEYFALRVLNFRALWLLLLGMSVISFVCFLKELHS